MDYMIIDSDIQRINDTPEHPAKDQIGFVGPTSGGHKIRSEISSLEISEIVGQLADMGDLASKRQGQLGDILLELIENHSTIIHCSSLNIRKELQPQFWEAFAQPVIVTSVPSSEWANIAYIGIQRHMFPPNFEYDPSTHVRLGEVRNNMERAEVLLRHSDCILIDLNSLRLGDNLGSTSSGTAGFMIEELCQIAKYAGASTNLKTIILNGFDENLDEYGMQAKNIALMIYYILDGFAIRQQEKKMSEQLQRYTVLPDHCAKELVFVEDQRSGRWWVELYSEGAEEEVKMACTKSDYEDACNNHISERITSLLTST